MRTDYHYYLTELANECMAQKRWEKNAKRITSDAMWRNNDYGSREVSSSSLSYDDIRMAAVGVGQKVHQFDQQYGVSQKCKDAAHTCAVKAKELDEEYEVGVRRSCEM